MESFFQLFSIFHFVYTIAFQDHLKLEMGQRGSITSLGIVFVLIYSTKYGAALNPARNYIVHIK